MVQGIILDVDGTLVLSNDAHAQAWIEAFAAFGYNIPFDKVRPLMGMGGDHVIPDLVPDLNSEAGVGKAIADQRKELIVNKFAPQLKPTSGSRKLVEKMREMGLQLIIGSSASDKELAVLLKVAQVDDLVQEQTSSDDAESSKPAPDLVEAALKKLQLPPEQVLMLADTPYDVESASQAGVEVIALRTGGFADEDLSGAIAIYDDPADLLAHYDQSPLAQTASVS